MSDLARHQVFISSTFVDLEIERLKVYQALLELDCIPAGMELFPASNEEQLTFIQRIIDDCDYYIVIIGGRYGQSDVDGISYTEKEYLYAKQKGIPVLAFLHSAPDKIEAGKSERHPDAAAKLDDFRRELSTGRIVKYWDTADILVSKVILALTKARRDWPRSGWIRGSSAATASTLADLADANRKVRQLEAQVAAFREQSTSDRPLKFHRIEFKYKIDLLEAFRTVPIKTDALLITLGALIATPTSENTFDRNVETAIARLAGTVEDITVAEPDINKLKTILLADELIALTLDQEGNRRICMTTRGQKALQSILAKQPEFGNPGWLGPTNPSRPKSNDRA